jgi:rod shape-determining protein MreC
MTVINADGLVGRIKSVSRDTSTVILAADPGSSVGVRVTRTGELGIVTGAGSARMHFTPLDPTSKVKAGDVLVTGPNGRSTYAPGVPFGKITKVVSGGSSSTPTGQVEPDVDFTSLDVLGVVLSSPSQPGGAHD